MESMNASQDYDNSKKLGKHFDDMDKENSQIETLKMQKAMKSNNYFTNIKLEILKKKRVIACPGYFLSFQFHYL